MMMKKKVQKSIHSFVVRLCQFTIAFIVAYDDDKAFNF